jgi:GMP synthase (glutamine-hydrolysing)
MSSVETIVVLDFGAQYNQLIARRVREADVYCRIVPFDTPLAEIRALSPKGVILTGGPASVYAPGAPQADPAIFELGVPVLGICYGMQWGAHALGGRVRPAQGREYGRTRARIVTESPLTEGLPAEFTVWMSHGDAVNELPADFEALVATPSCAYAAMRHRERPFYGVQFHPEVTHTEHGRDIFRNFLYRVCGCRGDWKMEDFIEQAVAGLRKQVGQGRVVLGLSGGVDSSVLAVLLHRAIGDRVTCIFVDHGLNRKNEGARVRETFEKHFGVNLVYVDAEKEFLAKLAGVTEPEKKRKIIGAEFIETFKRAAKSIPGARFLAQGTIYPDVIESVSAKGGPSAVIKSHHNVGGLPAELGFELVEPLRDLFKDEVRRVGERLGLPREIVWRQPFPGPGLAVRVLGEVTKKRLDILREADAIVEEEVRAAGLYEKMWQSFTVLLPISTVGVMGDERTYENVVAIRAVESEDAMTADWVRLPYDLLARLSSRIINEVKGVNRVVYDVSSKPPATIEWE